MTCSTLFIGQATSAWLQQTDNYATSNHNNVTSSELWSRALRARIAIFLQNVLKRKKTYVVEEKMGFNSPSPPPPSRPRSTNWKLEEEEEETKELQIVDVSQELRKSFVDGGCHCSFVCSFVRSFLSAPLSPKMFILVFFLPFCGRKLHSGKWTLPPKEPKSRSRRGETFYWVFGGLVNKTIAGEGKKGKSWIALMWSKALVEQSP